MRFGSLFSGIGGIDLGLERAGMECAWQCEINPFCQEVLAKHWPNVQRFGDVKGLIDPQRVDVLAGGFPCQPQSYAGKRKGKDDDRWLWPDFAYFVRTLRPRFVFVENVPGLFTLGFDEVLSDLADCGYDAEWNCIPAAAFGAPHLRYRIILVAHTHRHGLRNQSEPVEECECAPLFAVDGAGQRMAYSDSLRCEGTESNSIDITVQSFTSNGGDMADTEGDDVTGEGSQIDDTSSPEQRQYRRSGRRIGPLGEWLPEPAMDRVANGIPRRMVRPQLEALGNAVVPQVAEFVGRRIMEAAA